MIFVMLSCHATAHALLLYRVIMVAPTLSDFSCAWHHPQFQVSVVHCGRDISFAVELTSVCIAITTSTANVVFVV